MTQTRGGQDQVIFRIASNGPDILWKNVDEVSLASDERQDGLDVGFGELIARELGEWSFSSSSAIIPAEATAMN